ncbi:inositol monophosphatase family protein [Streptomyces sp. NRAIS4]
MTVHTKSDDSPVTEADREIEETLRARIRRQHPADAFLGEEESGTRHGARRRWIVDGIDGTASPWTAVGGRRRGREPGKGGAVPLQRNRLAGHVRRTLPALDWSTDRPAAPPPRKPSTASGTCHGGLLVATGQVDAFVLMGTDGSGPAGQRRTGRHGQLTDIACQ